MFEKLWCPTQRRMLQVELRDIDGGMTAKVPTDAVHLFDESCLSIT